jgi:hypothetical protein
MTRPLRLRLLAAATVCLGLVAYEGFTVDDILDDVAAVDTNLSASPDPAVQAAAVASEAIQDEKLAQESATVAVENHDLDAIQEAIALRPYDPAYRLTQSALLAARGDAPAALQAGIDADGLFDDARTPPGVSAQYYVDAYLKVRDSYQRGTIEWDRTNEIYCNALNVFVQDTSSTSGALGESLFTVLTYPAQDCP